MPLSKRMLHHTPDLRYEDVPVARLKGDIRVSEMTAYARSKYESRLYRLHQGGDEALGTSVRAWLVAACVVDEEGELVFDDDASFAILEKYPASEVAALYAVALRINGMDVDAEESESKNSAPGPAAGLNGESPSA